MASRQNKNEEDDESQNPGSPYYLHLGENPGLILVSPPLDGNNYHTWSRAMKCALLSKNKVKFIYGSIKTPGENEMLRDAWERCNVMVISWLTRSMANQIAQSVLYIDNARDL